MGKLWMGALAVIMTIAAAPVRADVSSYIATGSEEFGIIDLTSGAYTEIGNMGQLLSGLGEVNNGIYGGLDAGATVYQVDPNTGALTAISTTGASPNGGWNVFGSTTSGLFGLDRHGVLYAVDPVSGEVTMVGSTGLAFNGLIGLSSGSGTLYFADGGTLYQIDTATGDATVIGPTNGDIGALVYADGTLYAGANTSISNPNVLTLNANDGSVLTTIPVVNPSVNPNGQFWGLTNIPNTPTSPVPEPGLALLLGIGLLGIAAAAARRARSAGAAG